jgi:hypothetical protein
MTNDKLSQKNHVLPRQLPAIYHAFTSIYHRFTTIWIYFGKTYHHFTTIFTNMFYHHRGSAIFAARSRCFNRSWQINPNATARSWRGGMWKECEKLRILLIEKYPLVNLQFDPENTNFLVETNLPTPMTARVYVNLLEGIYTLHDYINYIWLSWSSASANIPHYHDS